MGRWPGLTQMCPLVNPCKPPGLSLYLRLQWVSLQNFPRRHSSPIKFFCSTFPFHTSPNCLPWAIHSSHICFWQCDPGLLAALCARLMCCPHALGPYRALLYINTKFKKTKEQANFLRKPNLLKNIISMLIIAFQNWCIFLQGSK